jgi:hypothetical protein
MAMDSNEMAHALYEASLAFASDGPWIYRDGLFIPQNICSEAAYVLLWANNRLAVLEGEIADLKRKKSGLIGWR